MCQVSGVVEGEEEKGEEEKLADSEEKTEQDVELQTPEEAQEHPDGDPVTTATNEEGDGAEAQEKEAEPEAGPSEKAENIDDGDKTSTNPEDSQMNEGEMPEDMVLSVCLGYLSTWNCPSLLNVFMAVMLFGF